MESWPIQCTRILLSWNHDRPWIDPRQCNYWNQKGNNNKSDCGAFALTAAFLICSKVSLCKQYTYMDTLTLLQVDTPYNSIDNYMDDNSTSKLPPPMLSQFQLILVFWRNKATESAGHLERPVYYCFCAGMDDPTYLPQSAQGKHQERQLRQCNRCPDGPPHLV